MLRIDGFDDAILGPAMLWDTTGMQRHVIVYDAEKIREILMRRDGMDMESAREFIEFNIEGAYVGPYTPVLVWPQDELPLADDE